SGTVVFDVDYRVPANSIITGLKLNNGASGANGPTVVDSGINATTRSISSSSGRGNIFRIADIATNDTAGIAALTTLMNDPTAFSLNLQTSTNAQGLLRGQLSRDTYAFFSLMTQAEENPPTNISATANSMTIVKVTRDSTGNITSGNVSFNVAHTGFDA